MRYMIFIIMSLIIFSTTGCGHEGDDTQNQYYDPDVIDLTSDYYPEYQDDPGLTEVAMNNDDIVCFAIGANADHPALRMYFFRNKYLYIDKFNIYDIQYYQYNGYTMVGYPLDQWLYPITFENSIIIEFIDNYVPNHHIQVWLDQCVRAYAQQIGSEYGN